MGIYNFFPLFSFRVRSDTSEQGKRGRRESVMEGTRMRREERGRVTLPLRGREGRGGGVLAQSEANAFVL